MKFSTMQKNFLFVMCGCVCKIKMTQKNKKKNVIKITSLEIFTKLNYTKNKFEIVCRMFTTRSWSWESVNFNLNEDLLKSKKSLRSLKSLNLNFSEVAGYAQKIKDFR